MRDIRDLWGVDQGDKIIKIFFVAKCVKVILLYHKNHADECDKNIKNAIDFFYDNNKYIQKTLQSIYELKK
ncbi:MAG: hypothetical protein LBF71_02740 [Campylobacteraceae bacterium]|jgi:effector-binding domain-containing protein|nr:hypothetical protein [Campylobacteraceae bacterium]